MRDLSSINPWVWKAHPEVWLLVIAIFSLGFWAIKIIFIPDAKHYEFC